MNSLRLNAPDKPFATTRGGIRPGPASLGLSQGDHGEEVGVECFQQGLRQDHGDDEIGGIEKPVARLVIQLSDSTAEILEEMSSDGAGGLKSAHHREMISPNEVPEGNGVGRFAR